jgi:hypothetical protein
MIKMQAFVQNVLKKYQLMEALICPFILKLLGDQEFVEI